MSDIEDDFFIKFAKKNMYDIIFIGSGPGGYVAAIRAAQLGMNVAVVEKAEVGGVCLNYGCIPTKALLKSAEILTNVKEAKKFGINVSEFSPDFGKIIKRSRTVASQVSKGVDFLFKKNNVTLIKGEAKIISKNTVLVNNSEKIEGKNIVIATGARAKELPNLKIDGEKIIGYRQALTMQKLPESMLVVGSGAIGTELAFFYATMGTKVTIVELLPNIVPIADKDVSAELLQALKRKKIKVFTNSLVESVDTNGDKCIARVKTGDNVTDIEAEVVLSSVGISPNTENLWDNDLNIETEKGFIKVDEFYRTNIEGIYAIGDVIPTPALAHVASAEGIICVEKIAGLDVEPLNYNFIPSAIFTTPEVGMAGITQQQAEAEGKKIKIGKFPMSALGKATAIGDRTGFAKLIFDAETDKLLGAHIVGHSASDMITELVVAMKFNVNGKQLLKTVHPHPTISEAIMEAAANAHDEAIHI